MAENMSGTQLPRYGRGRVSDLGCGPQEDKGRILRWMIAGIYKSASLSEWSNTRCNGYLVDPEVDGSSPPVPQGFKLGPISSPSLCCQPPAIHFTRTFAVPTTSPQR